MVKNLPDNTEDRRDVASIPGSGRSPGEGNGNLFQYSCLENSKDRRAWQATVQGVSKSQIQLSDFTFTFPGGSDGKQSVCNAGNTSSIPGSGRSPGEENGNPFQYSCLENSKDRRAWWAPVPAVPKSQTRLSD